jgi:hypothetical protein
MTRDTGSDAGLGGRMRLLLRVEAAFEFAALTALYAWLGAGWVLFAVLFLVPDLAMLLYFANPRVGAACYNAAHLLIGPVLLAALCLGVGWWVGVAAALIWATHIQFDRALGYGLKFASGFGQTHLGPIGRAAAAH